MNTIPNHTKQNERWTAHLLLALLCFIICVANFSVPTVHAEGISLKIAPSVLQLRALPPANIAAPFSIENQSNQTVRLKLGYKIFNKIESSDGIVTFLTDSEVAASNQKEIFDKVQVVNEDNTSIDTLELGPKQQKKLVMKISLPKGQKSADYYYSLVLVQDNKFNDSSTDSYINKKDQKSITTLQTGIGMNILLGIGPKEANQGIIDAYTTPYFSQSNTIPFTVTVKDTGTHYITPHGEIIIKNIFNATVDTIIIPPTAILAGTARTLLDNEQLTSGSVGSQQILWHGKYLAGFYKAELHMNMAEDGPAYVKTIKFFVLPLRLILLLILLVCGLALMIALKIRNRK